MNNLITIFVLSSIFIILISLIIIISKLFQNQNNKDQLIMSLLNKPTEKEVVYIQKEPEYNFQDSILPSPFFIGDYTLPYFNYYDDYKGYGGYGENKFVKKIKNNNHINIPYTGNNGNIKVNIN